MYIGPICLVSLLEFFATASGFYLQLSILGLILLRLCQKIVSLTGAYAAPLGSQCLETMSNCSILF